MIISKFKLLLSNIVYLIINKISSINLTIVIKLFRPFNRRMKKLMMKVKIKAKI
jgi:hypothetical protein